MDDDALLLSATFAQSQGLFDRSINTAERTRRRHDFALRYPTPFERELEGAARDNGLDEAFVYGLARQESRFVTDIVSASGAVGIMQLMPPTARWVARKIGSDDRSIKLADPADNARLGAWYLRHVLDRLEGLPVLGAAAYNAGPKRAQAWRASVPLEGAVYAETIPFTETRDYVKKVLANAMFYQGRLGSRPVTLKERLGVVPPRGGSLEPQPDSVAESGARDPGERER
jgi:soluble lytic murein transglycosylase